MKFLEFIQSADDVYLFTPLKEAIQELDDPITKDSLNKEVMETIDFDIDSCVNRASSLINIHSRLRETFTSRFGIQSYTRFINIQTGVYKLDEYEYRPSSSTDTLMYKLEQYKKSFPEFRSDTYNILIDHFIAEFDCHPLLTLEWCRTIRISDRNIFRCGFNQKQSGNRIRTYTVSIDYLPLVLDFAAIEMMEQRFAKTTSV